MQEKKTAKANLENYRPVFFLVGLALSLVVLIFLFEMKTEYSVSSFPAPEKVAYTAGIAIPVTFPDPIEKPVLETDVVEPEPEPEPIKPTDRFKAVDDFTKIKEPAKISLAGLISIGSEPSDPLPIEIIDAVSVQNMARPMECEGLSDKSEQMQCFNSWISRYLAEETEYPRRARSLGVEGKLYVQFLISETGQVEEVEVLRGQDEDLIEEAMRVLKSMPQFAPASQMGKPVKVRVVVPVNFKLR
jgi:protein TonB